MGDAEDGIYTNATQNNPTSSVTYTGTTIMTYLNRSGVTEGGSSMMGPGGGGPMGGGSMQTPPGERGQRQAPQTNDNNAKGETTDTK